LKEVPEIKATVMSLLFRPRTPRKPRRKSLGPSRPRHHASGTRALAPEPRAIPVPVKHTASRRRRRSAGYMPDLPRHSMFRVT